MEWNLKFVEPNDSILKRSDGSVTIGVTDLPTYTIYISNALDAKKQKQVLLHELTHAYCVSYGIYLPIKYEEVLCAMISDYGQEMVNLCNEITENLKRYYGET